MIYHSCFTEELPSLYKVLCVLNRRPWESSRLFGLVVMTVLIEDIHQIEEILPSPGFVIFYYEQLVKFV